jgi:SAM-dependent methyltransferase
MAPPVKNRSSGDMLMGVWQRVLKNEILGRWLAQRAYDQNQRLWEERWSREHGQSFTVSTIPAEVQEAVTSRWFAPGSSLLDIGCGSGELAAWHAAQGFTVLGVDYAERAITRARRQYGDGEGRLAFKTVDICRTAPGAGAYDSLLDRGCFHEIPRAFAGDYAAHVAGAARPGAHFLLLYVLVKVYRQATGSPQPEEADVLTEDEQAHMQDETSQYVRSCFESAFKIQRVEDTVLERRTRRNVPIPMPGMAVWMVRR